MSLAIGLTGGVGSGKSHVLGRFAALGVPVIEADDLGRAVVAPGEPALTEIARDFGADMLLPDGSLDRRRMRERVFGNEPELRRLEAITHPRIRARLAAWRDAQTAPYCLLSAAILIESGLVNLVQRVLVVDAPEQHQIQRLMKRDGVDETLARAMLARQLSRAERLARAHDVIENPDPPQALDTQIAALHARYLGLAEAGHG